ncbi:uncharacterized protein LOC135845402 isoform X2 [Planococcus citri]|uniref:uncharacterized protein LOC135845402 isoform X2 n=1 Tax=Planococcus citri TaxID=170843 RepID=UPI0031F7673D
MATNNNPVHQNENKLVFYSSFEGTLQELACKVVSISCYCQMEKSNCSGMPSEIEALPTVIREMIQKWIPVVKRALMEWDYIHETIFSHRKDKNFAIDFVSFISWEAHGQINEEKTAVNLMECDKLSQMEKYRLACIYCLVDDVKKLWPMETDADHLLIKYWNYRMSGQQFTFEVDPECSCVEASLLMRTRNLSAFEYLWGFLTDDEQVWSVTHIHNDYFIKCMLLKLSESQLERVLISNASYVFSTLSMVESKILAVSLWDHVKNIITPDALNPIFLEFLNCLRSEGMAYDIWMRAPEMLKNHVLANNFKDLLNSSTKDERLFLHLLLMADVETREIIWLKKWKDIIVDVSLSYLQQIMKLCLGSEDEVASFKRTHLSNYPLIKKYCESMILYGHFDKMSEFFQFSSNDPEIIFNLRKNVLKSQYLLDEYIKVRRYTDMDSLLTFLRETFPDTNERNEFERNLILSDESSIYFRSVIQNDWYLIFGVKHFVCNILSSDADMASAKSMLLVLNYELLVSNDFSWSSSRSDFIKWCLDDDDDALDNFKRSLPTSQIFYTMFEKCALELKQWLDRNVPLADERVSISYSRSEPFFFSLTGFLEWVFPTKKAMLYFKFDKLLLYFSVEQMKSIFEIDDQTFIDHLLCWLLNDDKALIESFKKFLRYEHH